MGVDISVGYPAYGGVVYSFGALYSFRGLNRYIHPRGKRTCDGCAVWHAGLRRAYVVANICGHCADYSGGFGVGDSR